MANPYANLRPGDTCLVEGEVEFSHILRPYEGEELQKQIERARKAGQKYPPTSPYTKITLRNAKIIPNNGQPTAFDQVMVQNLYIDEARKRDGRNFTIELINKGKYAPNFGYFPLLPNGIPDFQHGEIISPEGELKTGQRVRVVMKVFSSRNGNGCGIDAVLCLGEPEYYTSNAFDYSAYGMFVNNSRSNPVNENAAFVNPYSDPVPAVQDNDVNPYAFGNPNEQPVSPYGNTGSGYNEPASQMTPNPDAFGNPYQSAGNDYTSGYTGNANPYQNANPQPYSAPNPYGGMANSYNAPASNSGVQPTDAPNPFGGYSAPAQNVNAQPASAPNPYGATATSYNAPAENANPYAQTANAMPEANPNGVNMYGNTGYVNEFDNAVAYQNANVNRYATGPAETKNIPASNNGMMTNTADNTASASGGITAASVLNASGNSHPSFVNEPDQTASNTEVDDPNKTF